MIYSVKVVNRNDKSEQYDIRSESKQEIEQKVSFYLKKDFYVEDCSIVDGNESVGLIEYSSEDSFSINISDFNLFADENSRLTIRGLKDILNELDDLYLDFPIYLMPHQDKKEASFLRMQIDENDRTYGMYID